jgi:hypothetical protein
MGSASAPCAWPCAWLANVGVPNGTFVPSSHALYERRNLKDSNGRGKQHAGCISSWLDVISKLETPGAVEQLAALQQEETELQQKEAWLQPKEAELPHKHTPKPNTSGNKAGPSMPQTNCWADWRRHDRRQQVRSRTTPERPLLLTAQPSASRCLCSNRTTHHSRRRRGRRLALSPGGGADPGALQPAHAAALQGTRLSLIPHSSTTSLFRVDLWWRPFSGPALSPLSSLPR